MTNELVEKLSNLSLLGYYDQSLKMLCVHFFGDTTKHDLMAYLKHDLTWDLREVLEERTELTDISATVIITHGPLGMFAPGSRFDEFIRQFLTKSLDEVDYGSQEAVIEDILNNGYARHTED